MADTPLVLLFCITTKTIIAIANKSSTHIITIFAIGNEFAIQGATSAFSSAQINLAKHNFLQRYDYIISLFIFQVIYNKYIKVSEQPMSQ